MVDIGKEDRIEVTGDFTDRTLLETTDCGLSDVVVPAAIISDDDVICR